MKSYPKKVCWDCAHGLSKVKDIGAITVYQDHCDVCGNMKGVSTPGDYGWPDFKGFVKVKRRYIWD